MTGQRILVAGATGQVGSQVVRLLLERGHFVRALIRKQGTRIGGIEGMEAQPEYAVGSLEDRTSLVAALDGIDTVVSSANGVIPSGRTMSVKAMASGGYDAFISAAEEAGVRHWVQSSVPSYPGDATVPELKGKRLIERRLENSPIAATIVRNPAFMDVWLVMAGAKQATARHPHATTKRPYGFMRMWQGMVGNLVVKRGILLAPGGRNHGAPLIAVIDVAHIMAGMVGREESYDRIIEAGGPAWVTWGEVAELLAKKAGRPVRTIAMPPWVARIGQTIAGPIMPSAANVLALVKLVASYQPRWEAPAVVEEFGLPPQVTLSEYLDANWSDGT